MSDTVLNMLSIASLALVVLFAIFILIKSTSNSAIQQTIKKVSTSLPLVLDLVENLAYKDKSSKSYKQFETLKEIAKVATEAVEQVYSAKGDLTSEQKLSLAKESFYSIAKTVDLKIEELDEKLVEALIESAVHRLP
ncbi:hypothetical protein Bp8pS_299 [Bacillus phage vB_BpuM-BpSp]|nr:hypothetical protein Bp8pS_299 [Bacillus phage vB_BpuM-BpSp]